MGGVGNGGCWELGVLGIDVITLGRLVREERRNLAYTKAQHIVQWRQVYPLGTTPVLPEYLPGMNTKLHSWEHGARLQTLAWLRRRRHDLAVQVSCVASCFPRWLLRIEQLSFMHWCCRCQCTITMRTSAGIRAFVE